jgi:hypothetical protein
VQRGWAERLVRDVGEPAHRRGMNNDTVADRLVRVRRRIESDVPYNPDWAAAVDELEEIEADLAAELAAIVTSGQPSRPRLEASAA